MFLLAGLQKMIQPGVKTFPLKNYAALKCPTGPMNFTSTKFPVVSHQPGFIIYETAQNSTAQNSSATLALQYD